MFRPKRICGMRPAAIPRRIAAVPTRATRAASGILYVIPIPSLCSLLISLFLVFWPSNLGSTMPYCPLVAKLLGVDKSGDRLPAQVVDFTTSRPLTAPKNGFACVTGAQAPTAGFLKRQLFLVPLPGPITEVSVPEDLYLDFSRLKSDSIPAIQDFAQRYGQLRLSGEHFHREPEMDAVEGEPVNRWSREAARFKAALNLWYEADMGTPKTVTRLLATMEGADLHFPTYSISDPAERARAIVLTTINAGLAPAQWTPPACALPGCHHKSIPWLDATRACLQISKGGAPDLIILSSNLIKTLWTQFACLVAGKRKLKKCEAVDCRLGGYMDVTDSDRPGARRMHSTCAERLKKRQNRINRKERERE
jgi:hypothetical protein